jgi:hypothetical protein
MIKNITVIYSDVIYMLEDEFFLFHWLLYFLGIINSDNPKLKVLLLIG